MTRTGIYHVLYTRWIVAALVTVLLTCHTAMAALPTIDLEIRGHLFFPDQIQIPANTKVRLRVKNSDQSPEEFESYELNREKVIAGGSKAVIFIGPLPPGSYPFFGEFHPRTAQGKIIVKEAD